MGHFGGCRVVLIGDGKIGSEVQRRIHVVGRPGGYVRQTGNRDACTWNKHSPAKEDVQEFPPHVDMTDSRQVLALALNVSLDQVVTPDLGDEYVTAIRRWSDGAQRNAQFVVFPKTTEEVAKAVKYAADAGLELAVKGGGHSCSGASSSEGLVVDLARMRAVKVDAEQKLAHVEGGALWSDVDDAAFKHGLATVGGTVNNTGVGGLTLGGGFGMLTPKHGLTIDVLREAEVVVANGEVVVCNANQNEDLFWGIRGGGSNFGVVTRFSFELFPQDQIVWSGLLVFTPDKLEPLFEALEQWYEVASENEAANLFIGCGPPSFQPVLVLLPFYNGPESAARQKFQQVLAVGPVADLTKEMPYPAVNAIQDPMTTHGDRKLFKAASFTGSSPAMFQEIFNNYSTLVETYPDTRGSAVILEFYRLEKVLTVPASDTAFANRVHRRNINFVPRWKDAALDTVMHEWAKAQVQIVRAAEGDDATQSVYANYGFGDERARDLFGDNYARLAHIKAKYDPHMLFKKWYPVTPQT